MTATAPQVPIAVDPDTGIWTTDGLPMIYLPRHFYMNHLAAFEAALGRDRCEAVVYEPGYRSAWEWCAKESARHGLRGEAVFRHYMARLSQRGWGRFFVEAFDPATGEADVRVEHSAFLEHRKVSPGHARAGEGVCYCFSSWLVGALEWVAQDLGREWRLTASEARCGLGGGQDHCLFAVRGRGG